MTITEEIFHSFLHCQTKSYLRISHANGIQADFSACQEQITENYKGQCIDYLKANYCGSEHAIDRTDVLFNYHVHTQNWSDPQRLDTKHL